MLNKKIFKLLILILIVTAITMSIPKVVNAGFFDQVTTSAQGFLSAGTQTGSDDNDDNVDINGGNIVEMFKDLFEVFITAGMIIALVLIAILGIRFLLSSAEGKAEIKEKMTPYVVGVVVTFGAYAIWRVVISILAPLG